MSGTIRKRTWTKAGGEPTCSWQVSYVDQFGKRRAKQFGRRKDADAFLTKARHEVSTGTHTPESTSITIQAACAAWLARCEAFKLERGTLRTYRLIARHHVLPMLGHVKLAKLTAGRAQAFVYDLLNGETPDRKPRSREMAAKAKRALHAIVDHARRNGMVAQNVVRGVELPSADRHKERVAIPPKDHVRRMLEAAGSYAGGLHRPLLVVACFTGLRASELRGLRWCDVDLQEQVVRVRQRADLYCTIGRPKSAAGTRDIPMMQIVLNTLREWKLRCPRCDLDLVFPTGNGTVHRHGNLALKVAAIQRSAGLEPFGLHAFRHFACSVFIEAGFQPKRVSALMGHSTIGVTFDRYGHLFPSPEDDQERLRAAQLAVMGK